MHCCLAQHSIAFSHSYILCYIIPSQLPALSARLPPKTGGVEDAAQRDLGDRARRPVSASWRRRRAPT